MSVAPLPAIFVTFLLLIRRKNMQIQNDVEFDFRIGHALVICPVL